MPYYHKVPTSNYLYNDCNATQLSRTRQVDYCTSSTCGTTVQSRSAVTTAPIENSVTHTFHTVKPNPLGDWLPLSRH